MIRDCRTIAQKAQKAREWHAAVSALREVRGCLELLGELSGELDKQDSVNVSLETSLVAPVLITQYVEMARDGTLKYSKNRTMEQPKSSTATLILA